MLNRTKKFCIVVTGLPASGKTTVGQKVAKALRIPYLDKDDFLEDLFQRCGIGDGNHRQSLSRQSDQLFQQQTQKLDKVVLISHWRPDGYTINSGTSTEWINRTYQNIVELYCDCPVELAANRFRLRTRHPGHLDQQKSVEQILQWMKTYQTFLPLNIGKLIKLDISQKIDYSKLAVQIESSLRMF